MCIVIGVDVDIGIGTVYSYNVNANVSSIKEMVCVVVMTEAPGFHT